MTVRSIVFDLFHTLANPEDYRPRDFDRVGEAAHTLGIDPDHARRHWANNLERIATTSVDPVDILLELRPGGIVNDDRRDAAGHAIGRYQDDALLSPIPGTVSTIETLRKAGWLIGLLSNAHVRDIGAWPNSPLSPLIDVAHFSCHRGVAKPEPSAYTDLLNELGVEAGHSVFVGDGGSRELEGARSVGFGTVVLIAGPALKSGFRSRRDIDTLAHHADTVITSIEDLGSFTERLSGP